MSEIKDIRMLIICILAADVFGAIIYGMKGNVVGIFNCISWAVVAGFVLFNFKTIFKS